MRALARDAELLVLDEPTAALSGAEVDKLHAIIRALAAAGRTVILVSHFLGEVLALADTVTILRDGRLVRTGPAADETEATLIAGMLGRSATATYPEQRLAGRVAPRRCSTVRDLVAPGVRGDVVRGPRRRDRRARGARRRRPLGAGARDLRRRARRQAGSVVLQGADALAATRAAPSPGASR